MLYAPELHEPLSDIPWDAARAHAAIQAIVADAERVYDPKDFWPADEWDGYQAVLPMKNIYCGAGGVCWGLERLRAGGHAETALDLPAVAQRALARFREEPDYLQGTELPTPTRSSLFLGEAGLATVESSRDGDAGTDPPTA